MKPHEHLACHNQKMYFNCIYSVLSSKILFLYKNLDNYIFLALLLSFDAGRPSLFSSHMHAPAFYFDSVLSRSGRHRRLSAYNKKPLYISSSL